MKAAVTLMSAVCPAVLTALCLTLLATLPAARPASHPAALPQQESPMPKITPFLWYDADAEQAIDFYATVFPDTKILEESRWGAGGPLPAGTLMSARVRLGGQEYMFLNGGPTYRLNEAFSLFINCETQAEVDAYWGQLTAGGGEPGHCGWLKDRFGLSWQVIPSALTRMLSDKDPARAGRTAQAMMGMGKLDIAALQAAYDGSAR